MPMVANCSVSGQSGPVLSGHCFLVLGAVVKPFILGKSNCAYLTTPSKGLLAVAYIFRGIRPARNPVRPA